jgi:hypothetical protein
VIKDSFVSKWTGKMSVFRLSNGRRISFKQPIRVEKGQGYVITLNERTGETRMYPV